MTGRRHLHTAVFLAALCIAGCDSSATHEQKLETMTRKVTEKFDDVPQLSTEKLATWLADSERKPPQILDAREPAEFAVSHLPGAIHSEPAIAFIGGSGLYQIDSLEGPVTHEIPTPFGDPSGPIVEGRVAGRPVCFLARHGHGHRLVAHEINHRANIWALRSLGVRWAISITAVGSLREEFAPRHAVVPHQLVDRTGRAHEFTFFGTALPRMSDSLIPHPRHH